MLSVDANTIKLLGERTPPLSLLRLDQHLLRKDHVLRTVHRLCLVSVSFSYECVVYSIFLC
jgi:hypothetical protein